MANLSPEQKKKLERVLRSVSSDEEKRSLDQEQSTKKISDQTDLIIDAIQRLSTNQDEHATSIEDIKSSLEKQKGVIPKLTQQIVESFGSISTEIVQNLKEVNSSIQTSGTQKDFSLTLQNIVKGLSQVDKSIREKPVPVWRWPQYLYSGIRNTQFEPINPATEDTLALIRAQTDKLTFTGSSLQTTSSGGGTTDINLAKYNGSTVGALNAVYVQPGSGSVFAVSQSGAWTVTQGTSPWLVSGDIASGAADSGNPVKIGGRFNSTLPTLSDGQRGDIQMGSRGSMNVTLMAVGSGNALKVNVDNADVAPTATADKLTTVSRVTVFDGVNHTMLKGDSTSGAYVQIKNVPHAILDSGSTTAVTQTTSPWVVSLTSTTITGSVAVTQSTSPWIVAGGGTAGTAASGVVTVQGIASMTPVQVSQATAASLNATVVGTGTFVVQATLAAETTKVIGVVRTSDGAGNLLTSNSSTYTAKFALDGNLLGTLGTAFSTAGKVDVKGADGDVFVRQATGTNLHMVVDSGTISTITNVVHVDDNSSSLTVDAPVGTPVFTRISDGAAALIGQKAMSASLPVVLASDQASIPVAATLTAETTKVIGVVRNSDGAGNLLTSNSTTYTAKFALDGNLLGTLGTAFSTAGKVDVKGADGDVFVRQATGTNLHTVIDSGTLTAVTSITNQVDTNLKQVGGSNTSTAASGVQKVGIVGSTGVALDGTVAAGTAPTNQLVTGLIYNTTAPIPTNGQTMAIQGDQAGNQLMAPGIVTASLSVWNSATALNTTQTIFTKSGVPAAVVHLVQSAGTFTAGAITFEVTYDNSNWVTISADCVIDPTSATMAPVAVPYTLLTSTNKAFLILTKGAQGLRMKLSTAITGTGTVTPNYELLPIAPMPWASVSSTNAVPVHIFGTISLPVISNVADGAAPGTTDSILIAGTDYSTGFKQKIDSAAAAPTSAARGLVTRAVGDLAAANALNSTTPGMNSIMVAQLDDTSPTAITENSFGNVRMSTLRSIHVTRIPESAATIAPSNYKDKGTVTKANVKNAAGNVFSFRVTNANAAARYFQLHNKATAPVATETAQRYFVIPAGTATQPASVTLDINYFAHGVSFATGIGWAISTTADTFTDSATAGDHTFDINYL